MKFMIGCNYWASHAGTEMWRKWDESVVDRDFKELAGYGIKHLRVFPIWRDFQPVAPYYGGSMSLREYRMENGELPKNEYYIDEDMIGRFRTLCKIAEKHGIRLIVGIVTGWMSGRLFIPSALNNLNLFTDPRATMLTQKFVHGFVEMTKDEAAIEAWDLGNECNCMAPVPSREAAYTWCAMISDAIRAKDSTRRIISGMHGLRIGNEWTISDQGELTDILTTHPYPYWVQHTRVDETLSTRTLLHATAEAELYAALSGKPVLVEEIGTMGPEVCSDDAAGIFMKCQLFTAWAHGHMGLLWWCAFDQNELVEPPYEWTMVERYLGLFRTGYTPKPALLEMKRFSEILPKLPSPLPEKTVDAVCILSRDIDHWGVAYMTYILAKQAGLTVSFVDCEDELPEADCYLLPSIKGTNVMAKSKYEELKAWIKSGATLYVSIDNAIITEFEQLVGARIRDSYASGTPHTVVIDGSEEELICTTERDLLPTTAEVLLYDKNRKPMLLKNEYGKGTVFYLDAPLESGMIDCHSAFDSSKHKLYEIVCDGIIKRKPLVCNNPSLGITYHSSGEEQYAVIINYSGKQQETKLTAKPGTAYTTIYGNASVLDPGEACIIKF